MPDELYYGGKCAKALEFNTADIHLQIQADASCADWAGLVRRCRTVHTEIPAVGVWAPEVDYTFWHSSSVTLSRWKTGELRVVAQTDSIVWSLSRQVVSRLRVLDFTANTFGWGIDWAAVAYALSHGLLAVRDPSVQVHHPRGTGYDSDLAARQMQLFLEQLTPQEGAVQTALSAFVSSQKEYLTKQHQAWQDLRAAIEQDDASVILIDEDHFRSQWNASTLRIQPFLNRDGQFAGRPPDDASAISELERMIGQGARYLAIVWTCNWWATHYALFVMHLQNCHRLVEKTELITVFELSQGVAKAQSSPAQ